MDVVEKMEEHSTSAFGQVIAWIAAGVASIAAWAIRTSVFNRLSAIEERMISLEKLTAAAVSQVELAKSVDALRAEIAATRLEIKSDVAQIVKLLKGD
jgi:hypothetical protein